MSRMPVVKPILCLTLALIGTQPAPTAAQARSEAMPPSLSASDIDEMFSELSNWGRWGDEDQRGTLNLVTPDKRRQAASLVRRRVSRRATALAGRDADHPSPMTGWQWSTIGTSGDTGRASGPCFV